MPFFSHLKLYLWKNLLEKRRHVFASICEIICPLILTWLLVLLFLVIERSDQPNQAYDALLNPDDTPLASLPVQLQRANHYLAMAPEGPELDGILGVLDAMYPAVDLLDAFNPALLAAGGFNVSALDWTIPVFSSRVKKFASSAAIDAHIDSVNYDNNDPNSPAFPLWAAVIFDNFGSDIEYTIRFNASNVVGTDDESRVDPFERSAGYGTLKQAMSTGSGSGGRNGGSTTGLPEFGLSGFMGFQLALDRAIINKHNPAYSVGTKKLADYFGAIAVNSGLVPVDMIENATRAIDFTKPATLMLLAQLSRPLQMAPQSTGYGGFPSPAYKSNAFYGAAEAVFALFFVLTVLLPVARLVRGIVHEKETRIREGMMTMGMSTAALNTAWYITYSLVFAVIALLVMVSTIWNMFGESNPFLVFVLFFLFGVSTVSFCFMLSAFFSRAKTASIIGMMTFFAAFFVKFAITADSSASQALAACLSSPVAFGIGIDLISAMENDGVGITFDTDGLAMDHISFSSCMWMMVLDTFIYFVIGWYFYEVLPSEFGVPRPIWFPFTKAYWCGETYADVGTDHLGASVTTAPFLETPHADLREKEENDRCIKVRGLTKKFNTPDGIKTAVNGLDLTMYEGQIFCLLGHNGAGKTTTISMLTGLIKPSGGEATMFGKSISEHMKELRKDMGWCPQHNVLFNDLTVKEHLEYFAGLKGVDPAAIPAAVAKSIRDVGLVEKTNALSRQLSGGQKRKLSVAIALIGDSKIVFLDEPTSGMDPYSRRSTWNVLQNSRAGRIIILTTHFMDEADLLGDRIGIMADGAIRCCGTPMFLKNRYGVGYSLTAVKGDGCDADALTETITRHVPTAKTLSNVGAEISFQLPMGASSTFPAMLAELEDNLEGLAIETFGISVTTMEEVFLKVAEHGDEGFLQTKSTRRLSTDAAALAGGAGEVKVDIEEKPDARVASARDVTASARTRALNERANRNMCMPHFIALMQKRLRYGMRDKKSLIFQLFIPVITILLVMILLNLTSFDTQPRLKMSTAGLNPREGEPDLPNIVTYANLTANNVAATLLGRIPSANASLVGVNEAALLSEIASVTWGEDSPSLPATSVVRGMSSYLLNTRSANEASRFGAYIIDGDLSAGVVTAEVLQNGTFLDGGPTFANLLSDAIYKHYNGDSASISTYSQPLPLTRRQKAVGGSVGAIFASLLVVLAFGFIPASFIVFIVRENEVSAKHQQLISGVSIVGYWLSNFAYDCIAYCVPCGITLIIIKAFDVVEFMDDGAFTATLLLFLLFGPAAAAFTYMLSFFFKSHSTAQNSVLLLSVLALLMLLVSFIMQIIPSVRDTDADLRYVYRLLPGYCLGEGLNALALKTLLESLLGQNDVEPLDMEITMKPIIFMCVEIVVYLGAAIGMDVLLSYPAIRAKVLRDPVVPVEDHVADTDVAAEAAHVLDESSGTLNEDAVRVKHLRKVYGNKKVAVRDLTFGIRKGECFGFLGINGAGKTTTLKILSGDEIPSVGTATLYGFDILRQQRQVRQLLGYCPQFDALLDLLTTREHLELFAKIKGVPSNEREAAVAGLLKDMDLVQFENKLAGTLSGGNKRKLSVAIAMISEPPLMFLDEPSTGMDPVARRFMWKVIARMAKKASIVLVSHSMEECEALCNRISIMVGGRIRCMGSVQHLKKRFGDGFSAELQLGEARPAGREKLIKRCGGNPEAQIVQANLEEFCKALGDPTRAAMCHPDGAGWSVAADIFGKGGVLVSDFVDWWLGETEVAELHTYVMRVFPDTELVERQGTRLRYKIPIQEGMRVSEMFAQLERARTRLNLESYALSQTSLEEIFNYFASQQEEETGSVRGMNVRSSIPVVGQIPTFAASSPRAWSDDEGKPGTSGSAGAGAGAGAGVGTGATGGGAGGAGDLELTTMESGPEAKDEA